MGSSISLMFASGSPSTSSRSASAPSLTTPGARRNRGCAAPTAPGARHFPRWPCAARRQACTSAPSSSAPSPGWPRPRRRKTCPSAVVGGLDRREADVAGVSGQHDRHLEETLPVVLGLAARRGRRGNLRGVACARDSARGWSPGSGRAEQINASMSPADGIPLAPSDGLLPGDEFEGPSDSCGSGSAATNVGDARLRGITLEGLQSQAPANRAPPRCGHSTTRSARSSNRLRHGKSHRLRRLQVDTSSKFVGCWVGRSAGLAPFRILSTKPAARRNCPGCRAHRTSVRPVG